MHLKQDFWSIRGQMTYLALGLCCFNVSSVMTKLIPVATGNTRQALADFTPDNQMQTSVIWKNTFKYLLTLNESLYLGVLAIGIG